MVNDNKYNIIEDYSVKKIVFQLLLIKAPLKYTSRFSSSTWRVDVPRGRTQSSDCEVFPLSYSTTDATWWRMQIIQDRPGLGKDPMCFLPKANAAENKTRSIAAKLLNRNIENLHYHKPSVGISKKSITRHRMVIVATTTFTGK